MEFNGIKITTTGDAKVEILKKGFRVYNNSNSGLDGFILHYEGEKGYSINYGTLEHVEDHNATIRSATMMKDELGQVSTISETCKRYDKYSNNALFGFNTAFLQNDFNVIGLLDGQSIFNFNNEDVEVIYKSNAPSPGPLAAIPWPLIWEIAKKGWEIFAFGYTLWSIYDSLRSKQTVEMTPIYVMGEDGVLHVVGYEVTVTYDPIAFPITINNKEYKIDSIQFKYSNKCHTPLLKPQHALIGEQVTLFNIPYIDIESIEIYE